MGCVILDMGILSHLFYVITKLGGMGRILFGIVV